MADKSAAPLADLATAEQALSDAAQALQAQASDDQAPATPADGDARQAAANRVVAAFFDSIRNSPISRNTEVWNCLVETAAPALTGAVLKEL